MNLYIREAPTGRYEKLVALIVDTEGKTVGRVSALVANWLILKGVVMDLRDVSEAKFVEPPHDWKAEGDFDPEPDQNGPSPTEEGSA